MRLLALIPARGGSKGIPRKNVKALGGKPLLGWTVNTAKRCPLVKRVVVSTEDCEIAGLAMALGADVPFIRPASLAADDSPGVDPVLHALEELPEFDWVLLLQPTSPFRSAEDIEGIVQLCLSQDAHSAVSVTAVKKHPYWVYRREEQGNLVPMVPDQTPIARRQDLPPAYALNGALYLAQRDWLFNHRSFLGPGTLAYVMPEHRSVDIDTQLDWDWAEFLIARNHVE